MVENEIEKETVYIGATLKEHREKQDVSIHQVANQLHLDNRIIIAIENDDYDSLPDPIYIRGYIRGYCKILNLSADEMLQIYKESAPHADPEIIPEIKYPTQSSSSDKPVKAFTYLISLGLVLLVITWWQSNFIVTTPITSQAQLAEPQPPSINDQDLDDLETLEEILLDDYLPNSDYNPFFPSTISIAPGSESDPSFGDLNIQANDDVTVDGQVLEDISQQFMSEVGFEAETSNTSDDMQESEIMPDNGNEDDDLPSTGPDTLVLNITADSWIDISDTNEQKVYFDLGRTGDQLVLKGTAPFDITLGFAQGVTIDFNGENIDPSPYTRAGVARFTLGE